MQYLNETLSITFTRQMKQFTAQSSWFQSSTQTTLININIIRLHKTTKLTYLNVYNTSWVKTFNERMSRKLELRAEAGLAHHPFSGISPNNDCFLYKTGTPPLNNA